MQTNRTVAIILRRINYAEADKIITLLTRDYGKQTLIAKGVRKVKSKLAGGIELFCESDISFIRGKGEIGTLVSTKLERHFKYIHSDYDRMTLAAQFLKRLDSLSENDVSSEYYDLTIKALIALNTTEIPGHLSAAWATHRLLNMLGEGINVEKDSSGNQFDDKSIYRFSYEENRFTKDLNGEIDPALIKFIRYLGAQEPAVCNSIKGSAGLSELAYDLIDTSYKYNKPTGSIM